MFIYWVKANVNFLLKSYKYNVDGAVTLLHYLYLLDVTVFLTWNITQRQNNTQILIKVSQLVFSEYIMVETTRVSITCHREKNFRKACGGIGTCSELLSTFSSFSWNSGSWSAIQGCPIDFQNRQRQLRHSWIISAYSSRRPNDLRTMALF